MNNRAPADIGSVREAGFAGLRAAESLEGMFAPEVSRPVPLGSVATVRLVQYAQRALDGFTSWRNARATRKELLRLSDWQLSDIGLHRGQVDELAEGLAHG